MGDESFSHDERAKIADGLQKKLTTKDVARRTGPKGSGQLTYVKKILI
jgi:hypothetical protein